VASGIGRVPDGAAVADGPTGLTVHKRNIVQRRIGESRGRLALERGRMAG